MGATGQTAVPKKAIVVVRVVKSMALAASGKALAAIWAVEPRRFSMRAFFHLSTATNTSSAPSAKMTKMPCVKAKEGIKGKWMM